MQKIVILGGSNAYWEINELISDINYVNECFEVIGILEDNQSLIGKTFNGITIDGPLEKAKHYPDDVRFVLAIGSYRTRLLRAQIIERIGLPDDRYETLIHPTAKVFSTAAVKSGCIIHYGSIVFNHTVIEPFSIISANCVIAVSNLIGRGALFGSGILTTTNVKVGSYCFIGSGVKMAESIEVEPGAHIGLGSILYKSVSAGSFVLGNPPRVLDKSHVSSNVIQQWVELKKEFDK
ncbi:hypothetical protein ACFLSI_03515 [Bacteroidota bacterium]